MAESATRLRRLIEDQVGSCRDEDVEHRLNELSSLADQVFEDDVARPIFNVLGDRTRYRLARVLSAADEQLCVCELEPLVDVSPSAVSHALSDLVEAGLVTRRKAGNWRYYRTTDVADELLDTAVRMVDDDE